MSNKNYYFHNGEFAFWKHQDKFQNTLYILGTFDSFIGEQRIVKFTQSLSLLKQIKECNGDVVKLYDFVTPVFGEIFYDIRTKDIKPRYNNRFIQIASDWEQASIIVDIFNPNIVIAYSHYDKSPYESLPLDDLIFLIESFIRENELYNKDKDNYTPPQEREGFEEYTLRIKTGTTIEEVLGEKKYDLQSLIPKPIQASKKQGFINTLKSLFKFK